MGPGSRLRSAGMTSVLGRVALDPHQKLLGAGVLDAVHELSGFVHACALVRPGRAIAGLEPASVKKKLKDKAFARSVSRDDIYNGVAELGVELEEHIAFVREALLEIADQIGV